MKDRVPADMFSKVPGDSSTYDATQGVCVTRAMLAEIADPCPVCHGRRVVPLPELATADRDGVVSVPQVGCPRCQPAEPEADKPVEVVG